MLRIIKQFITKLIKDHQQRRLFKLYNRQWLRYMKEHGFENKPAAGEEQYMSFWRLLSKYVSPLDYRYFSHFKPERGGVISIPENIGHTIIEATLNPAKYTELYLDKNMFPKFVGAEKCPKTIVCRINGSPLLGADYKPLTNNVEKVLYDMNDVHVLVLKPSVDSCSGHGVKAFKREQNRYFCNGQELTEQFLEGYGQDFTLQEGIRQSDYMSQFNVSSVNTIRVYVYKSVKDNRCHVVGGVLRIGKVGSFLDNAHAGGRFVGINMENGELGKMTYNTCGFASSEHNGIDFSKCHYQIPNWKDIKEFAKTVVTSIPHMRYVGLDIALDKNNKPILIEYNCGNGSMTTGAGFWLLLYTQQHPFGEFTDEIVEYCLSKHKKICIKQEYRS